MCDGGIVVADQPLSLAGWTELPPPEGVKPGRYFMYRVGAG